MKFKKSYETWMAQHRKLRSGERMAQLDRRDHYGEMLLLQNVLLPTLGTFTHLHPEYEMSLIGARTMYLDIAYVNKISREQFAYERKRDIMLKLEGGHVRDITLYIACTGRYNNLIQNSTEFGGVVG